MNKTLLQIGRWIVRVVFYSLVVLLVLVGLLYLPPVQSVITSKVENYLNKKLQTRVELGTIRFNLDGDIILKDIYLEDQKNDTLLKADAINTDLFLAALFKKEVLISNISLKGLVSSLVIDPDNDSANYKFIIDAFSSKEKKQKKPSPWKFGLANLTLSDIRFTMNIQQKLNLELYMGHLDIHIDNMDYENMDYNIGSFDINNSSVRLKIPSSEQEKETSKTEQITSTAEKQNISADLRSLGLRNVDFELISGENMNVVSGIDDFQGLGLAFDLNEHKIHLEKFALEGGFTNLITALPDSTSFNPEYPDKKAGTEIDFLSDFNWDLQIDKLFLSKYALKMDQGHNMANNKSLVDPAHLSFEDIEIAGSSLSMNQKALNAQFDNFMVKERSGLEIREFTGLIRYDNAEFSMEEINFLLNRSRLQGTIRAGNDPFKNAIIDPGAVTLEIQLSDLSIHSSDLQYFIKDTLFAPNGINEIRLNLGSTGSIAELNLNQLNLAVNNSVELNTHGTISNLISPEKLTFDICLHSLYIPKKAISPFLISGKKDKIFKWIPSEIQIQGDIKGGYDGLITDLDIKTPDGQVFLAVNYRREKNDLPEFVKSKIEIQNYSFQDTTLVPGLGEINLTSEFGAEGWNSTSPDISAVLNIKDVGFNSRVFNDIGLNLIYNHDSIGFNLESEDPALLLDAQISGRRIDSLYFFDGIFKGVSVDLNALSLTKDSAYLNTDLRLNGHYGKNIIAGDIELKEIGLRRQNSYTLKNITANLYRSADSTSIDLNSPYLSVLFNSNIAVENIPGRVQAYLLSFITHSFNAEDSLRNGYFEMLVKFKEPLDGLEELNPNISYINVNQISSRFDEREKEFRITADIPQLISSRLEIDTSSIYLIADERRLTYTIKNQRTVFNDIRVEDFMMKGQTTGDTLSNRFTLLDSIGQKQFIIGFDVFRNLNKDLILMIKPDTFVMNYNRWMVSDNSHFSITPENRLSGKAGLRMNDQSIDIEISNESIYSVKIEKFAIGNIAELIRPSENDLEISGFIDLQADINNAGDQPVIDAGISVSNLIYAGTKVGDIDAKINSSGGSKASLDLELVNHENKARINGNYNFNEEKSPVDLRIDINVDDLSRFESFANEEVNHLSGKIYADMEVKGTIQSLYPSGNIRFSDIGFYVKQLNGNYTITNEKIEFKNRNILFNQFIVKDAQQNNINLDGRISIKENYYPEFNLQLKTNNFKAYNASKEENPGLYGQLFLTANANITGEISQPDINVDLTIEKDTKMNYVLPAKEINLVSDEGIVEFINPDEVDTLSLETELTIRDTLLNRFRGITLSSNIAVKKEAQFTVEIDPRSGDFITIQGSANLNLNLGENTDPVLTGIFEVYKGMYDVSFYGLVKKTFEFQEGSNIIWTGNPYNANLDLSATYTIRTSSTGLLSRELAGVPAAEMTSYQRPLPYEVKILINGTMKNPDINFEINLLEINQAAYPMVLTKLNRLNEEGNESELAQQVFGLLTLGSFIPERTTSGGSGSYGAAFATTAAANSLNGILTNQLNNLSGKYLKGFNVDIGMQSYSEMNSGSTDTRTTMDVKVSKNLFNERIKVEAQTSFDVGSEKNSDPNAYNYSNFQNDFAIIYDITEKGDYKLKVFDKSSYDIIYKDIRTTGVALIFIREFDKISGK